MRDLEQLIREGLTQLADEAATGAPLAQRSRAARLRRTGMLVGAATVAAVLVIGLATAAHQAFSANLYTLPSDLFPRAAVGSVIGIGGTVGALGGMGMALFTGYILDSTGSYAVLFAICASAYVLALLVVHLLTPRLEPVPVPQAGAA